MHSSETATASARLPADGVLPTIAPKRRPPATNPNPSINPPTLIPEWLKRDGIEPRDDTAANDNDRDAELVFWVELILCFNEEHGVSIFDVRWP